ncbi:MAG: SelB C-terminal domain-containing protein [Myxococcales bacterium]|nr:SelB C-terminal domain-containing protein [Myxococcales bacterium]
MIIGTAGHVNHGKTTLVRALTGVDCDRLEEEKRRGITIALGFARWRLPDGREVSVVDVPGHASLGHTMATGALGLDAVLLVVAAHEGVMPQTREHVAACDVLGVRRGVIVLTHVDRCDDPEVAAGAVRAALSGSFLADAPLVRVNAPAAEGLEELGAAAAELLSPAEQAQALPALLPVDRVFPMRGFGTVVTGSLIRGQLATDDRVELGPGGRALRVRTLHVHGDQVDRVVARCRVGVGLPGVEPGDIERGAFLAQQGEIRCGRRFDAEVHWQPHMPRAVRQARSLGYVCGGARAQARFRVDAVLEPGARGTARVTLDRDVPLVGGLRFVLRGASVHGFGSVVAGGRILDAEPPARRTAAVRARLAKGEELVDVVVEEAGEHGVLPEELGARLGLAPMPAGPRLFAARAVAPAGERVLAAVRDHQQAHPAERGMLAAALQLGAIEAPALQALLDARMLLREGPLLRTPDFDVRDQASRADDLTSRVERFIESRGLTGPSEDEVRAEHGGGNDVRAAIRTLESERRIVRTKGICFATAHTDRLMRETARAVVDAGTLPVAWLKDYASITRKHAIPLWTWLDNMGVTVRHGNARLPGPRARSLVEES